MLSVFPGLLSYQMFSPLLIRLVLASILIFWSYRVLFQSKPKIDGKIIALIEGVSGILLIIGLYTQIAALVVVIYFVFKLFQKYKEGALLTKGINYYLILLVLAISLLLTGPGAWAFDFPL